MKNILLLASILLSFNSLAGTSTVCGDDSRTSNKNIRIGRMSFKNAPACTITMIGKSCAISAGHCQPFMKDSIVEFDVPMSKGSQIQAADPKNLYLIDSASIQFDNNGFGRDWAVFKLKPNAITKAHAGDVNGKYAVNFKAIEENTKIQIAGFGLDSRDFLNLNGTLQIAFGKITEISEYYHGDGSTEVILNHDVDTEEGNSGAAVVRTREGDIIGIHTHGSLSCAVDNNKGTLFSENKKLRDAITNCLK